MPEDIFAVQTELLTVIFWISKTGVRKSIDQIK